MIFVLLFFACAERGNHSDRRVELLSKVRTITLPLDEFSSYEFFNFQVIGDTLAALNYVNYSLDFYSLKNEEFLFRIPIESQGDLAVPKLYSFLFHNPDTIFLFSQFRLNTAMIVDVKGTFVDRIKVTEFPSELHGLINHASVPGIPSYLFGNELHFCILALTEEGMKSNNFIQEYTLNIETGEFGSFDYVKKPKFYHNKKWVNESFSRLKLGMESWLYSWNNSDTVYHINRTENGEIESVAIIMNGGIPANPSPISEKLSPEEILVHTAKSYIYGRILIDNEKQLLHRLRYIPMNNPSLVLDGSENPYLTMDFEIITTNLEGQYLGSTRFKAGTHDPRVLFLGPDGIYIPLIHPEYSSLQEDQIQYEIFQVAE